MPKHSGILSSFFQIFGPEGQDCLNRLFHFALREVSENLSHLVGLSVWLQAPSNSLIALALIAAIIQLHFSRTFRRLRPLGRHLSFLGRRGGSSGCLLSSRQLRTALAWSEEDEIMKGLMDVVLSTAPRPLFMEPTVSTSRHTMAS